MPFSIALNETWYNIIFIPFYPGSAGDFSRGTAVNK
jgi:hypothetical protein